jgi:sugar lactone lactonase YvrE
LRLLTRIGLALLFVAQLKSGFAQSGIITTHVGPGFPVNGALATTQDIDGPTSVVPDGNGGFYIASPNQNRVYRVAADGRLSFVAGNGIRGFSGDGWPATSTQLDGPNGVAVDSAGNLFIVDTGNSRIRKVTPGGIISTVAGNGTKGFSGDGGPATSAELDYPSGAAVDSKGNLFIADEGNDYIRKVTPGGVISTVAGDGNPGYSGDGGPATSAQLDDPSGIAVDSAGSIFIADEGNDRIGKVTPGGIISTVAGNGTKGFSGDGGPATSAQVNGPKGVAVDSAGNLFIADEANHHIRKVTPGGVISSMAGKAVYSYDMRRGGVFGTMADNVIYGYSGDGGVATSAQLDDPSSVAVDSAGNLFIADTGNSRIRKVTPGGVISTVAGNGPPSDWGSIIGGRNRVIVASNGSGGYSDDGGPASSAQLYVPSGVAVDSAGNLFIADTGNARICKVTPSGIINTVAGNGTEGVSGDGGPAISAQLDDPSGIVLDPAGNLFIADMGNNRIRKMTPDGVIITVAGNRRAGYGGESRDGGPATSGELNFPRGVALDSAGNLFIADCCNHRIRMVTSGAVINSVPGNGRAAFSGNGGTSSSKTAF